MHSTFSVDILCRVVDNYGDAGVVLRLAKGLSAAAPELDIRLIVDDLATFSKLLRGVDPHADVQRAGTWTIVRWNHPWEGFVRRPARLVVESLACGRPEHYEKVLFDPSGTEEVLHINLEYLSAETYAEEFHLLPSFSPVERVKKYFFLPGFTAKTGGLVLDPSFLAKKRLRDAATNRSSERKRRAASWGIAPPMGTEDAFWISVFVYDLNFNPLVESLARWKRQKLVLLAEGGFRDAFLAAWEAADKPFPVLLLPFLPQDTWDDVLLACDLSLVRGEESLSRAALGGRPFLWQAYKQEENHHRIKVAALLERLKSHFTDPALYATASGAFEAFNADSSVPEVYLRFLRSLDAMSPGFRGFSSSLEANGDLAEHLLEFVRDRVPGP